MIEQFLLLALIIAMVFVGTHDLTQIFLREKETRTYWLKRWFVVSIVVGVLFWSVLLYSGK